MKSGRCHCEGVDIDYRIFENPSAQGTLVFSGGLGGTHLIWASLTKELRRRFRIIIWDYPGMAAGAMVPDDAGMDVPSLANYLRAIVDEAAEGPTCLVGWSLGVQVSLELLRQPTPKVVAVVGLCGLSGKPFFQGDGVPDYSSAAQAMRTSVLPGAIHWLTERLDRIDRFRNVLRKFEKPTRWAKRLGLVDPIIDEVVFDTVIRDFLTLDTTVYRQYALATAEHDASDTLAGMEVPFLAFAGEKDRSISSQRVKAMAEAAAQGEFFLVRGATHYLPLEYPELIALKIEDFLQEQQIG